MATLAAPIRERAMLNDPASVKVVFDNQGRAMYFSRSPIPASARMECFAARYGTSQRFSCTLASTPIVATCCYDLPVLPVGRTEQIEKLEQLRILEQGVPILIGQIDHPTHGIDTPADYKAFVSRHQARQPLAA